MEGSQKDTLSSEFPPWANGPNDYRDVGLQRGTHACELSPEGEGAGIFLHLSVTG